MLLNLLDVRLSLPLGGGQVDILHGVNVGFEAGKTTAIVGPSGSGKTSLMMICAGLLKASAGQVWFGGQDITQWGEDALADLRRDNMGIVFQNFYLIPTMSALENVAVPLELAGVEGAIERARSTLCDVGLEHRLGHYPSQLSGGEQQRVAIARALVHAPKIILADEPTGNLDQDTGRAVIELLFERARAQGASLVLITHDMDLAAACDMQVHLKDGLIVGG